MAHLTNHSETNYSHPPFLNLPPGNALGDGNEDDVVPDSDDEEMITKPEVVAVSKGISYDRKDRRGGVISAGERRIVGYSRRVSRVVRACPFQASGLAAHSMIDKGNTNGHNFIQTDGQSHKPLALRDDGILGAEDQLLVDTSVNDVVLDHSNWDIRPGMTGALDGNARFLINNERMDGKKDLSLPLVCDHELARLNFVGSQEPGELSQINALEFVDRFLSCYNVDLPQEVSPRKTVKEKSFPLLIVKGSRSLAKRVNLRSPTMAPGNFEWGDSHQDGETNFFSKKMEKFSDCGSHGKRSVIRTQKARHLFDKGGMRSANGCEDIMCSTPSESRFMDHNFKESGMTHVSAVKSANNVPNEERLDESSEQKLEANGVGGDGQEMSDIVFNTQMAAEVMEALSHAPLVYSDNDDAYQSQQNTLEDSLRCVTKGKLFSENCSLQKKVFSGAGDCARKAKQIKRHADKLSEKTSNLAQKDSKKLKELDYESTVRREEKRGKSLAENEFNCMSPANVSESSSRWSSMPIKQSKAEGAVDRDNLIEVDKYLSSSKFIEGTPNGKVQLRSESRSFSPIACRTRKSINRNKGSLNKSTEGTSDVMEIGVLRRSLRSGSSVKGKCLKFSSNTSAKTRKTKLSQKEKAILVEAAAYTNIWIFPKRKRTRRNRPVHSKVANDLYVSVIIDEKSEGNGHSLSSRKRSISSVETTCMSLDVKRRTQSSLLTRPSWSFPENILKEILLDEEVKQYDAECASPVKSTKRSRVGSSDNYMGYGYHKQPCNKNLPRSSLIKELIQLGVPEIIPNSSSKYMRRRKKMTNIRVLLSQNLEDDIIKQQKKILARLGISIASCCSEATHFVTDKFVRTRNMLEAMAVGKPVVTHLWLESCGQVSCLVDEKKYILKDAKKEKEIGFSMPVSLARASQHPLLKGQRVFITPKIKPGKEMISSLVKAVHGQAVEKIHKAAMKDENISKDVLILSCEEDYAICVPFLDRGVAVYSSELLLNGIVIQKLEYGRHQLFTNHINQSASGI